MVRGRPEGLTGPAGRGPLVVALAALGLGACEGDPIPSPPLGIDALPEIPVVEELRIGSVEDPDAGLTQIAQVAVDEEGFVYVVEQVERAVKRYDPEGRFLGRIGRLGNGPGEFAGVPTIGVRGDTLWALEAFRRRMTLFSREGAVLEARQIAVPAVALHALPLHPDPRVRIPPRALVGHLMPFHMLADGSFLTSLMPMPGAPAGPQPGPGDTVRAPRLRLDVTGAVLDTVGWEMRPPPPVVLPTLVEVGELLFQVPPPPDDEPLNLPTPTGSYRVERRISDRADAGSIRVTRLDLQEDTVFSREAEYRPNPYPPAFLDSLLTVAMSGTVATRFGDVGVIVPVHPHPPSEAELAQARREMEAAFTYPTNRVPIERGWVDADERLWLRRDPVPGGPERWVVMSPDGEFLGQVLLEAGAVWHWARGDVLWASYRDDLGVPWLSRYRLTPSP